MLLLLFIPRGTFRLPSCCLCLCLLSVHHNLIRTHSFREAHFCLIHCILWKPLQQLGIFNLTYLEKKKCASCFLETLVQAWFQVLNVYEKRKYAEPVCFKYSSPRSSLGMLGRFLKKPHSCNAQILCRGCYHLLPIQKLQTDSSS